MKGLEDLRIQRTDSGVKEIRPILKFPGGKWRLWKQIEERISGISFARYVEPMVGAGGTFFRLASRGLDVPAILADASVNIVNLYRAMERCPGAVYERLLKMPVDQHEFDAIRQVDPRQLSLPDDAARTLYLNRCCYNGLWRVNSRGEFNSPWGNPEPAALLPALRRIGPCHRALTDRPVEILFMDFRKTLSLALPGDLVFLDPPYLGGFTSYTAEGFSHEDHRDLRDLCFSLVDSGCSVVAMNSNTDEARTLWEKAGADWSTYELDSQSCIGPPDARHTSAPRHLLLVGVPKGGV